MRNYTDAAFTSRGTEGGDGKTVMVTTKKLSHIWHPEMAAVSVTIEELNLHNEWKVIIELRLCEFVM